MFLLRATASSQRQKSSQSSQEKRTDSYGSAIWVLRKEVQRSSTDRGASEVAETNDCFVETAVLTFRVARVHRIEERGIIDEADSYAEDNLGQNQNGQVRNQEDQCESDDKS